MRKPFLRRTAAAVLSASLVALALVPFSTTPFAFADEDTGGGRLIFPDDGYYDDYEDDYYYDDYDYYDEAPAPAEPSAPAPSKTTAAPTKPASTPPASPDENGTDGPASATPDENGAESPASASPEEDGADSDEELAEEEGLAEEDLAEPVDEEAELEGPQARAGFDAFASGHDCSYANPNTGAYASTLCWLDLQDVSTAWVQDSWSSYETITSANFNSNTFCPFRQGGSGSTYLRVTVTWRSALGAAHGSRTFTGCGRSNSTTSAQNNSRIAARNARNAALFSPEAAATDAASDSNSYYGPVTNYPIEIPLAGYTFTADLSITAADASAGLRVRTVPFPTWSGSFLGNNGFYTGVTGNPALYQNQDGGTTVAALANIKMVNNATSATSTNYAVVVADAESTDSKNATGWPNGEQIVWSASNGNGFKWLPNDPVAWAAATGTGAAGNRARRSAAVGNACNGTAGGTTGTENPTAWATLNAPDSPACSAGQSGQQSPKTGTAMLQISPANASSSFSVTQTLVGGGLQGVAFGVLFGSARVNVQVADRILGADGQATQDNFTGGFAAAGLGTYSATASGTATTATTEKRDFPLDPSTATQLTFNTSATGTTASSYRASWVCWKSTSDSTTQTRWPASGSSTTAPTGTNAQVKLGEFLDCTVTYTPPYLTLVKTVDANGTQAADLPASWTLTAEQTSSSKITGASGAATVTRRPVAVGTYNLTEAAPATPTWQHGYTWSGLACTASTAAGYPPLGANPVTITPGADADATPIATATLAIPSATAGYTVQPDVTCTYTNKANEPKLTIAKTSDPATGTTVQGGQTLTYTLTFDNSGGSAPMTVDHADHLRDVLDDATFVGNIRYAKTAGPGSPVDPGATPLGVTATANNTSQPSDDDWPTWRPYLKLEGAVPARTTLTVLFDVQVKANEASAVLRQNQAAPNQGYLLRNYLTAWGDNPMTPANPPATCVQPPAGSDEGPTCTQHPVRAWTILKESQPSDGAAVHSGGNIYYRVRITNYSGENLTGIQIQDNLTQTLAASIWDTAAPPAVPMPNGISFYDANDNRIPSATYDRNWSTTGTWGHRPTFTHTAPNETLPDGTNRTCVLADQFPGGEAPGHADGCWTMVTLPFDVPAQIDGTPVAYAVVGYAVRAGNPATGRGSDGTGTPNPQMPNGTVQVESNAQWVNAVQGTAGTFSGAAGTVEPSRCSAAGEGVPPGWVPEEGGWADPYADCKTYHMLQESYFHIWKKFGPVTPNPPDPGNNLQGATFLLADTEADARAGNPSRWLCRTNNDPNSGDYVPPGSDPADSGSPDWGADSETHAAIEDWNAVHDDQEDVPLCGLFFYLEHDDQGQAAGSWRARDVRGGDTQDGTPSSGPLTNWRNDSALNVTGDESAGRHGTYWLVETVSPTDYQLLSQPMQLWVAPPSATPGKVSPGNPEWYSYQGRLSLPVVGVNETAPDPLGDLTMGSSDGTDLRNMCVDPWQLPRGNQPNCIMPTGWTMPVFDVKAPPLPLSGGSGASQLLVGGLILLMTSTAGAVWWTRRRRGALSAAGGGSL